MGLIIKICMKKAPIIQIHKPFFIFLEHLKAQKRIPTNLFSYKTPNHIKKLEIQIYIDGHYPKNLYRQQDSIKHDGESKDTKQEYSSSGTYYIK